MENEGRLGGSKRHRYWVVIICAIWLGACASPAVENAVNPPIHPPVDNAIPSYTATASPAPDACVIGKWRVEDASLAAFISEAIVEGKKADYELMEGIGWLTMHFKEDGAFSMQSQDYQLTILIQPEDSFVGETTLMIRLTAEGAGRFMTADKALIAYDVDYEGGRPDPFPIRIRETSITSAPLRITPGWFFNQMWHADDQGEIGLEDALQPSYTNYQCSQDQLILDIEPDGLRFLRLQDSIGYNMWFKVFDVV